MATKFKLATDRARIDPVVETINNLDQTALDKLGVWNKIAQLADHAVLERVDASPFSIVVAEQRFEATATISVMLEYSNSDDEAGGSFSEDYLATVRGSFSEDGAMIDEVDVDLPKDNLT